jgi:membrane protein YqaA with SNARE-associated domain
MPSSGWQRAIRIFLVLGVVALSGYVFAIRDQAARLAAYGYPGIFLISVLANATLFLPAPGIAIVFAMGSVFNPALVGLVAGAGAAIGEMSGYAAGVGGQGAVAGTSLYHRIFPLMERYGAVTTLVLAAVPNPFFDLAGMAAGALRMPAWKFLLWCFLGKTLKMLIFAYTGAYSVDWLVNNLK